MNPRLSEGDLDILKLIGGAISGADNPCHLSQYALAAITLAMVRNEHRSCMIGCLREILAYHEDEEEEAAAKATKMLDDIVKGARS